jgi:uncharacterized membrane protein
VLLVGSLALNLLVLGAGAGLWLRFGGDRLPPGASGGAFFREMPPDLRREMRAQVRGTLRSGGFDRRDTVRKILTAIRADPFDPAEVGTLMAAQAEALQDGQRRLTAVWLDQLAGMSAAERAAYAARVEEALRRRRDGKPRE